MPVAAARLLGEHDTHLWRMLRTWVAMAQKISKPLRVGVDETASRRGHEYISVFVDLTLGVSCLLARVEVALPLLSSAPFWNPREFLPTGLNSCAI